jgi:argininosuccinate lyase
VGTATWDREALAAAAGEGFATATGVADLLAMHGVPFRTAHEAVATAALERADGADAVDVAAIEAAFLAVGGGPLADHIEPDLVGGALDPFESVRSRDSVGGPAPARVAEDVEAARDGAAAHREAVASARGDLDDAEERLARAVSRHA